MGNNILPLDNKLFKSNQRKKNLTSLLSKHWSIHIVGKKEMGRMLKDIYENFM